MLRDLADVTDSAPCLLVALIICKESTALLKFGLPAELAAVFGGILTGGALASRFDVTPLQMLTVVVLSAMISDSVAHGVGRRHGASSLGYQVLIIRREQLLRAHRSLARRPGLAILLGRFTLFRRRVLPSLAGVTGIPLRRFLLWNALSSLLWGGAFVTVGYALGSLDEDFVKVTAAGLLLLVVLGVLADAVLCRPGRRARSGR